LRIHVPESTIFSGCRYRVARSARTTGIRHIGTLSLNSRTASSKIVSNASGVWSNRKSLWFF
jgi:hypothetical protein